MGTCLCLRNHIIDANFEEKPNKDEQGEHNETQNNQDVTYVNTNTYHNKSTVNNSPELKRQRSPYSTYGQSSLSLSSKSRPILNKMKNKSKSTSSLIVCEKK